jgi:hypothetical protein
MTSVCTSIASSGITYGWIPVFKRESRLGPFMLSFDLINSPSPAGTDLTGYLIASKWKNGTFWYGELRHDKRLSSARSWHIALRPILTCVA